MKNIQKELANIRSGNFPEIYLVLGEERYFIELVRETILENALDEADKEAEDPNTKYYTHEEVFGKIRRKINGEKI